MNPNPISISSRFSVITWYLSPEKGETATRFCESRGGLRLSFSTWLLCHVEDTQDLRHEFRVHVGVSEDDRPPYLHRVHPTRFCCLPADTQRILDWLASRDVDTFAEGRKQRGSYGEMSYVGSPDTRDFFLNWDLHKSPPRRRLRKFCESIDADPVAETAWEVQRPAAESPSSLFDLLLGALEEKPHKDDHMFVYELAPDC